MTQLYFHCSHAQGVLVDQSGTAVDDLNEARDHATGVVRSLIMTRSAEDWRSWVVHVTDKVGAELFVVPFAFVLGRPH
ncbi:DUF6894 family protein [Bradyrhizobium lablabi]|uniref:DUF6894 family protein n=1 Tax=Bradyrhizobium lablabi TaxID=722472 RepID=UPI002011BD81|nr:hypothetical protein [Bradyrhizobium lablabi]